jgi:hypothetical protein
MIAVVLFAFTGVEAARSLAEWRRNPSLDVAGAHWLHLPPADDARLRTTVAAISQNCRELLSVPRMPSYSLWSMVPMAEPKWITSGPEDIREEEVREIREHEGGCVLVSQDTYLFWRKIKGSTDSDRLVSEIERTMNSISSVQELTLYRSYSTGERADATANLLK